MQGSVCDPIRAWGLEGRRCADGSLAFTEKARKPEWHVAGWHLPASPRWCEPAAACPEPCSGLSALYTTVVTERPLYYFKHNPSVAEFAVFKHAYLDTHPKTAFKLIATSALVLDTSSASAPRVLLLQHAASDSNPGKWEPPGGAVNDDNLKILYAAARELWEEASLQAAYISGLVSVPHFFARSNGDKNCRFKFTIHVENEQGAFLTARLNPKQHQQSLWATESEVRAGRDGSVM